MAEKLQAGRKLRKTILLANCPFCNGRMLAERAMGTLLNVGCSTPRCCLYFVHGVFCLEEEQIPEFVSSFNTRPYGNFSKPHRVKITIHPANFQYYEILENPKI